MKPAVIVVAFLILGAALLDSTSRHSKTYTERDQARTELTQVKQNEVKLVVYVKALEAQAKKATEDYETLQSASNMAFELCGPSGKEIDSGVHYPKAHQSTKPRD